MHIVNIMLSPIGGGIEQASVDYCEGLKNRGHRLTAVTHPKAVINPQLAALGIDTIRLRNIGEYDLFAIAHLRRELRKLNPDIVIAHTGRSFAIARKAVKGLCPLVGVAHNYNKRVGRIIKGDAAFTTTHDLITHLAAQRIAPERIFHIPNMVRCEALPVRPPRHATPVIGTMGRFVEKKGFHIYIEALKILRARGYNFRAVLGGVGEEEARLRALTEEAGLADILTFPGWVEDKRAFYTGIEIFCLPSLHEPFGIVLLEAFIYGTPVVATDTEGPSDIITANFDALIVKKDNPAELAAALAQLLDDPHQAASLALNAFVKAKTSYSIESVSERIEKALAVIIGRWNL
jgi:glycosyltransferase involved in cell wall biosynthesis